MKINTDTYLKMLACPNVPPETGGILGMKKDVICEYFFDEGTTDLTRAVYKPNIEKLNKEILIWRKDKIDFCGIAHTHPQGQYNLSNSDIVYIKSILMSMRFSVDFLFFPIIIPEQCIFPYKAFLSGNDISIIRSELTVI